MSLVAVELDPPADLNHRWAALAATWAALGWSKDVYADGPRRHYHDGGGNWARMVLLPQGRAVLFGNDHEYSQTYWGAAAEYFQEPETDLLAGAPDWWAEVVGQHRDGGDGDWIGFVYAWSDGQWLRAAYDTDDGFASLGLPAATHAQTLQTVTEYLSDDATDAAPADLAVETVIEAGPGLTADQLRAACRAQHDVAAGVAAARACRLESGA